MFVAKFNSTYSRFSFGSTAAAAAKTSGWIPTRGELVFHLTGMDREPVRSFMERNILKAKYSWSLSE